MKNPEILDEDEMAARRSSHSNSFPSIENSNKFSDEMATAANITPLASATDLHNESICNSSEGKQSLTDSLQAENNSFGK